MTVPISSAVPFKKNAPWNNGGGYFPPNNQYPPPSPGSGDGPASALFPSNALPKAPRIPQAKTPGYINPTGVGGVVALNEHRQPPLTKPNLQTPSGVQIHNTPLGQSAVTPHDQWTPEMHQAFNQANPGIASAHNLAQARIGASQSIANRNVGAYNSMGRTPQQMAEMTNTPQMQGDLESFRRQKMMNNLTPSEKKIMALGAQQTESAPAGPPSLDRSSKFFVPEGQASSSPQYRSKMTGLPGGRTAFEGTMSPVDLQVAKDQQKEARLKERARQQEISDAKIIGNAEKHGLSDKIPAIASAKARTKARIQDMMDEAEYGFKGGSSMPGVPKKGASLTDQIAASKQFAGTELGSTYNSIIKNQGARAIHDYIRDKWPSMSEAEKAGTKNFFTHNHEIKNTVSGEHYLGEIHNIMSGKKPEAAREADPYKSVDRSPYPNTNYVPAGW